MKTSRRILAETDPSSAPSASEAEERRALIEEHAELLGDKLAAIAAELDLHTLRAIVDALVKQSQGANGTGGQALAVATKAASRIRKAADDAERKVLASSPEAKRLDPAMRRALQLLPLAAVKAVLAKARKAGGSSTARQRVMAAKPGSSLESTAVAMGARLPPGPRTLTPTEARARRAAEGGAR